MKNTIEIKAPDGYKFKEIKDGNIVFEPIQKINYDYVIEQLDLDLQDSNIVMLRCYSTRHAEKLRAINRLLNVAKYLNGDWKPDFSGIGKQKFYIFINEGKLDITANTFCIDSCCYFKTKELAKQAIEILGKDTIKLALSTDY